MAGEQVTIAAVGDIMANRDDPPSILAKVSDHLTGADIAFCQLETAYSDKGSQGSSGPRGALPHDLSNYAVLPAGGFDVVSVASNHTGDWGKDAFLDVIERLRGDGLNPVGGGANIDEARSPVILERNGTKIAFLAYCSVAPKGYYAAPNKWGSAPMRAITHYEPLEEDQPGTPCEILTWPDPRDLAKLVEDVKKVRDKVDVVAVSLHWGVHNIRALLADYQPVVAKAAIDAGADIIIGHHPHRLKGVEIYNDKVILYSIGNFAFDHNLEKWRANSDSEWNARKKKVYATQFGWQDPAEGQHYGFEVDASFTMIAKVLIEDKKIKRVSYVPTIINHDSEPVPYVPGDPEGKEVMDYLSAITEEAGLSSDIFTATDKDVTIWERKG